jgi:2-aminoethylphosphonate-pyruvate transaminase
VDIAEPGIDFLISSSNKCIQGAPGFAFVIARRDALQRSEGTARSLCLDLYGQWKEMDQTGKWRFTSPTHIVRAFYQALDELEEEGGIGARHSRYCRNQLLLVNGMKEQGFQALLPESLQSPIISSFLYPDSEFDFNTFYKQMKEQGFVLYPGKISTADTFRVGNIGEVYPDDIYRFLDAVRSVLHG